MAYAEGAGPAAAIVIVAALLVISRWVFSTGSRDRRMERERAGHGLLVTVTTAATSSAASTIAWQLRESGIRSTVAPAHGPDHGQPLHISAEGRVLARDDAAKGYAVLVFPKDLERARQVLG